MRFLYSDANILDRLRPKLVLAGFEEATAKDKSNRDYRQRTTAIVANSD
jgi:hypothetical protein